MQQQQKQQQHPLQQPWQQRRKQRQGRSTVSSATRAVDGQEQPQDPHDGIESSHLADALARVLEGLVHFQRRPDSHRADHVVRILHSERRTWVGPPKQTSSSRRSKLCIMFVHGVGLLTGPAAGVVGGIASGIAPALLVIVFCRVTTHEPPTNFVVLEYIRVLKYCNTRVPSSTRVLQFTANVKPVKQHESCARKSPVLWKYISLSGSVDKYTSSYNAQM
jgi:hypothetical protein